MWYIFRIKEPILQYDERVLDIESESNSNYECSEKANAHTSEHLMKTNPPMQGDVIKSTNPGIRDSVRSKVEGSYKIYHKGLESTGR